MCRLATLLQILLVFLLVPTSPPPMAQGALSRIPAVAEDTPEIPDELSPELVDGLLARMTDAEIRELLRAELVRRAEEQASAEADTARTQDEIEARLSEMAGRIRTRTARWSVALANLGERREPVKKRLALAQDGVAGMLLAALFVAAAGLGSALALSRVARGWRRWLGNIRRDSYWDKVVRTLALGVVEMLPVIGFVAVTRAVAPIVSGSLGPLIDYVWIYHAGVSYSWAAIIIARRAFAPDMPAIRIAPLQDDIAARLYGLLRRAVQIGVAGWLIAGLSPTLGLGFPPAMVTVALSGTIVAGLLLAGLVLNIDRVREATADVFHTGPDAGAATRIAVSSAPAFLGLYVVGAWLYWVAHWLERGQHRLEGPAGTLVVYLVLPIFDRMGREAVRSAIRGKTDMAGRFRSVFYGAWRMLVGLTAAIIVAGLWGIDVLGTALSADAPGWAGTGLGIVVTLLVGYLVWRLIAAALYIEKRVSSASEDVDPSAVPGASRLDTLTPLFRNMLLGFLAIIVTMIVLSAVGVDIGPLIASAGIVGVAIGFGAQSLVRDIFSGIFFLIDDAFRVGEYIELDADTRGEVESISVRSLQLRHHRGAVITIPFGELKHITNHNRDWVIFKMSFRMEPDTDPQKFKKLVKEIGKEFLAHPDHGPKFIEPLKSQGVYYVDDDSALVMRVKFKCKPRAQFVLRREIYHRLREVFDEQGLHMARRKVEVVGPDGEAVEGAVKGALPDEVLQGTPAPA